MQPLHSIFAVYIQPSAHAPCTLRARHVDATLHVVRCDSGGVTRDSGVTCPHRMRTHCGRSADRMRTNCARWLCHASASGCAIGSPWAVRWASGNHRKGCADSHRGAMHRFAHHSAWPQLGIGGIPPFASPATRAVGNCRDSGNSRNQLPSHQAAGNCANLRSSGCARAGWDCPVLDSGPGWGGAVVSDDHSSGQASACGWVSPWSSATTTGPRSGPPVQVGEADTEGRRPRALH